MEPEDVITQLVVGKEIRVCLGRKTGSPDRAGSLQLHAANWVPVSKHAQPSVAPMDAGVAPAAARGDSPPSITKRSFAWPRRSLLLAGAGVGTAVAVSVAAALLIGHQTTPRPAQALAAAKPATAASQAASEPQHVAQAELQVVKVVPTAYEPNAPALPLAPASSAQDSNPVPAQVVAEASQHAAPNREPVAHAVKKADEPRPPAVIVDDAPQAKSTPQAGTPPPTQPSAQGVPRIAEVAPQPKTVAAAGPAPGRAARLLAITPDSKAAVFTNPSTRLPEQFKVGDQLPTGETIRGISQKDGRVLTSAKEYHLE